MKNKSSCYTYFSITGDFNPDEITNVLNITPFKKWSKGDIRNEKKNDRYEFSRWAACKCEKYDVITANQMQKTLEPLLGKINTLINIKNQFNVSFSLVVVPEIYPDEITPCLSPSLEVIDFCHATRTEIDIDYYIFSDK